MRCLTLGLGLTTLLVACGGDDPPTEREFRAEATRLCTRHHVDVVKTPLPDDDAEADRFERTLRDKTRRLFDSLRELDGPEQVTARMHRALDRGVTGDASQGLLDMGLDACGGSGATVFRGGLDWNEDVKGACTFAVEETQMKIDPDRPRTAAAVADNLRLLARELEDKSLPPREVDDLVHEAIRQLRASARGLDDVAAGRDPGPRLARSIVRGGAAFFVLNVEGCDDIYRVLTGDEPS